MAATAIETIPTAWDETRDIAFFQITARLFDTGFLAGATVLLATYDDDQAQPTPTPVVELSPPPAPNGRSLNRAG